MAIVMSSMRVLSKSDNMYAVCVKCTTHEGQTLHRGDKRVVARK